MKINTQLNKLRNNLDAEATRFHELAKDLALELFRKPDPEKSRLVRDHIIRSETFRTAATMADI